MSETETEGQAAPTAASRPFDVHRWSDYPELHNCLTELVRELEGMENRERQRGDGDRKKLREAVRTLVLDLYVAWKTDPNLLVGISLANRSYTTRSRYRALYLHWTSFKAAYVLLVHSGYIEEVQAGFHDPRSGVGRNTRIRATRKLIDLLVKGASLSLPRIYTREIDREIIELRDSDKNRIEYEDSADVSNMRIVLQRINAHFQAHWIDLHITDKEYRLLQARMTRDYENGDREHPVIDMTRRTLVRIFNNSDWEQGGRFYGGWWQNVPKQYRPSITIDDKPTVEVDYSTFHPVLLYAQIGQRLEGNAYDLGVPGIPRKLIKDTFNKMINAPGRIRMPTDFSAQAIGMDWKQFQAAIAERHAPIKQFFNSGHGLKLQRLDSDLAQAVMLRFIGKGMGNTCLPVHDSFLVHAALADELRDVMIEEFRKITGQTISVETIKSDALDSQSYEEPKHISPMLSEDHFAGTGEYAGYEQRRLDWLYGMKSVGSA